MPSRSRTRPGRSRSWAWPRRALALLPARNWRDGSMGRRRGTGPRQVAGAGRAVRRPLPPGIVHRQIVIAALAPVCDLVGVMRAPGVARRPGQPHGPEPPPRVGEVGDHAIARAHERRMIGVGRAVADGRAIPADRLSAAVEQPTEIAPTGEEVLQREGMEAAPGPAARVRAHPGLDLVERGGHRRPRRLAPGVWREPADLIARQQRRRQSARGGRRQSGHPGGQSFGRHPVAPAGEEDVEQGGGGRVGLDPVIPFPEEGDGPSEAGVLVSAEERHEVRDALRRPLGVDVLLQPAAFLLRPEGPGFEPLPDASGAVAARPGAREGIGEVVGRRRGCWP